MWLREYASANLTPRTAEGYELIVRRHLVPALGKITLPGLKPEHIQSYQSEKLSRGRVDGKDALSSHRENITLPARALSTQRLDR
jgi:integrase